MVNILVDAATFEIPRSNRLVVRDANNFVYVFINGNTGFNGNIRAYKGNQAGEPTSFTEQDAANAPDIPTRRTGMVAAIDSTGLVHTMYFDDQTGRCSPPTSVRYSTFRTSAHATTQDVWAIVDEEITTPVSDNPSDHNAIAIDANDNPHVIYTEFVGANDTLKYNNRIGGTWTSGNTLHSVDGAFRFLAVDIMIGDPLSAVGADRPIIASSDDRNAGNTGEIRVFHGDALDPSSFIEEIDITDEGGCGISVHGSFSGGGGFGQHISMAQDSNDKITIAFVEFTTQDLMVVEHLHANSWATWETPVDVDTSTDYEFPSIAIDGTDRFIFVKDDTASDIRLWKATNGTWTEETCDDDLPNVGTFDHPLSKWASKNNNSPNRLDYVFEDATGVLYNTFASCPPPPSVPPPTKFISRADTTKTIATSDSSKAVSRTDTTNAIARSDSSKTISRKDTTKSINR